MANGKVCTGFSLPYVAVYSHSGTTVSYSDGVALARGVDVSIEPESSDQNIFYADNASAESAAGTFTGGTITLTVDGLKQAVERLIYGLPTAGADGFTAYDDTAEPPYMGVGYIARYMEDGVTTYCPTVLAKVKFSYKSDDHATQEEEIDWQTQELEATIFRSDDANRTWKWLGSDYETEALAEAALKTKLNI